MKALFIAPNDFRTSIGGSSNRMQQTSSLLENSGFEVELLIVGPSEASHINIEITKKNLGPQDVVIEDKYDLIFCNYLFLLERLSMTNQTRLICDIHDDIIDRDNRLGADWITRSIEEVRATLERLPALITHISITEKRAYETLFPSLNHFWLPYKPQFIAERNMTDANEVYDFGFIGTQNSVNAKSVVRIVDLIEKQSQKIDVLVAGSICNGIKKAPEWMQLMSRVSLSSFYRNIGALLCPTQNQTGASTKLVESLAYGVPVIAEKSLRCAVGLECPSNSPINSMTIEDQIAKASSSWFLKDQREMWESYVGLVTYKEEQWIKSLGQ